MIEKIITIQIVTLVTFLFFLIWIIKTFFDFPIAIKYHKKQKISGLVLAMIGLAFGIFIILLMTWGYSHFSTKPGLGIYHVPFYILVLIEIAVGVISFFIGNMAPKTVKFVCPYRSGGGEGIPEPGFDIAWEQRNNFEVTSEWLKKIWWIFMLIVIIMSTIFLALIKKSIIF
jgi:hypothetical protein